jgi:hypothetical protein
MRLVSLTHLTAFVQARVDVPAWKMLWIRDALRPSKW